jgi:hypothetical protein
MNAHRTTRMVSRGRPIDREESMTRHALKEHETMGRITQRLLLAVTLALVMALPVLLQPVSARAAGEILDQAQTASWTDVWRIGGGYRAEIAQVVTAGTYGYLNKVGLYLDNITAIDPVTVSIQTVIDGMPSGIEIGKGTIPVEDLPQYGAPQWVDVQINGGVGLVMAPGTQYAIVVSSPYSSLGYDIIRWYSSPDVYPRGYMLFNEGSSWSRSITNADTMFQTYVIPDSLDQFLYYPARIYYSSLSLMNLANTNAEQAAQTFTAGQIGVVDRVRLYIQRGPSFNSNVEISIQTTDSGYPSGVEIGHGFIPWNAMPGISSQAAWIEAAIRPSDYVITGVQYAIVVAGSCCGQFWWLFADGVSATYGGGQMLYNGGSGWTGALPAYGDLYVGDAGFQTFVVHPAAPLVTAPPGGPTITPCSFGICPAVTGNVTPADSTARVTSNVQFRERPDGTVHGILNFNDSRTGDLALKGCVTDSAACRLTVTKFACTDEHEITVEGKYTPKGGTATYYELNLSGVKDDIGTFTLTVGDYTYTLTRYGIVDVTCP